MRMRGIAIASVGQEKAKPHFGFDKRMLLPVNIYVPDFRGVEMDTELARTFLTVVSAGNFIGAADRLHVSQSTVSTRILALEDQLGCKLFVRNKAGTVLTAAGRQFQRHATALVRTVEQARHDIGIPKGFRGTLVIGGRVGLWEEFLFEWMAQMQTHSPDVSMRAEIGFEADIMQGLVEGRVDIGVMYTPQSRPGLKVEQLFEEKLILVSTSARARPEPQAGYVYVDWGPEFQARHSACFPNYSGPALTANVGWLGLQHILQNGGSGYFPRRSVQPFLKTRQLTAIRGAPEFSLPAYAVYPLEHDPEIFGSALQIMRDISASKRSGKAAKGVTSINLG
jgi:DNA-binding transcriptional LysR family regulator